ncbi:P-loop containing nucleoside triphosphate hydrolase protein [Rhodofomes roseus]|uniref:P-loop containing nucleoside triphosphate hydrolase protein n=1 Tax=Rhodofomes roseus TaxID=34475 RepID=A0ABQ8KC38_9APHY|nr:P-loop containing nucleoside triphosphate hydrolase protein [Rhodofomes roseus]KAH9834774.1 P-loop containing nucleoside triphosphate hydrolase protein [Rhodofomes roseus]
MIEPSLQVKRVDHVYNIASRVWTYEDTKAQTEPQVLRGGKMADGSDAWRSYCFVVVRQIPMQQVAGAEPTVSIAVKSPYLVTACKNVIGEVPTISWTVNPVKGKSDRSSEEAHILDSLRVLVDYIHEEHQVTISEIDNLLAHGEISYDLIYAILIPGTIVLTTDKATGEPRALKLAHCLKGPMAYTLSCTGIDAQDNWQSPGNNAGIPSMRATCAPRVGEVPQTLNLVGFQGVVKINQLPVYPIQYHSDEAKLKKALLARARKWMALNGVHHVHYQGTAVAATNSPIGETYINYEVDSRVMIDRDTFKHHNANYAVPSPPHPTQPVYKMPPDNWIPHMNSDGRIELPPPSKPLTPEATMGISSDDDLILASPVLYSFSLSDELWLEFNVEKVRPIVWSDEPFTNLVLPGNRRDFLRSLVEAHNSDLDFDDFVHGKGQGLVINLFGPPGVGKTLSAEATSEHLKRPLYILGGGDLGGDANAVDTTLKRAFSIAASWSAIVLIDEADVFLERRSMHDLARNAMVAVFLRHVEYYRGILFLTTNRVKVFDPAFLSRIHVALRFRELSKEAKLQIWQAFLHKVNTGDLTDDELDELVNREVNGRQIKNATRTAMSLAKSRGEKFGYKHLAETLDAMEESAKNFVTES